MHYSSLRRSSDPLVLDSCIEILKDDKDAISSEEEVTYYGVRFHLNSENIPAIMQAQANRNQLQIPATLLADFRYYLLFGQPGGVFSGLSFCSYYQQGEIREALMRSFISLDADSIHQIHQDCLQDAQFALNFTSAHYWLIHQLMRRLRLDATRWVNSAAWGISLPTVAATVLARLDAFLDNPWMFLFPPLMAWFLQGGIKQILLLIFPPIYRWCWRQIFSENPWVRKVFFNLISRLGW